MLRAGRVEQVETPQQLYDAPDNRFVAGFMGAPKMNVLEAAADAASESHVTAGHPALAAAVTVPRRHASRASLPRGVARTLGLRLEHLTVSETGLALTVELLESLGGSTLVHGRTAAGEAVVLQVAARPALHVGERFAADFDASNAYLFDAEGRAL